ncbi:hypothetical protein KKE06_02760 [Candidatus Micrarchaeota archaeon]|nr:hypothetical protein [Candidatus Micrarchaeota archaeon]
MDLQKAKSRIERAIQAKELCNIIGNCYVEQKIIMYLLCAILEKLASRH